MGLFVSEQHMADKTQDDNLMYQTIYQHDNLKNKSAGNNLTLNQVQIIQKIYNKGKLNKNNVSEHQ